MTEQMLELVVDTYGPEIVADILVANAGETMVGQSLVVKKWAQRIKSFVDTAGTSPARPGYTESPAARAD